jgi:hypothetical protein
MIDWFGLVASALWIAGLALVVATLGFARMAKDVSLRHMLAMRVYRLAIICGVALFAIGTMLSVSTWYERVGWLIVTALTTWEGVAAWRKREDE